MWSAWHCNEQVSQSVSRHGCRQLVPYQRGETAQWVHGGGWVLGLGRRERGGRGREGGKRQMCVEGFCVVVSHCSCSCWVGPKTTTRLVSDYSTPTFIFLCVPFSVLTALVSATLRTYKEEAVITGSAMAEWEQLTDVERTCLGVAFSRYCRRASATHTRRRPQQQLQSHTVAAAVTHPTLTCCRWHSSSHGTMPCTWPDGQPWYSDPLGHKVVARIPLFKQQELEEVRLKVW